MFYLIIIQNYNLNYQNKNEIYKASKSIGTKSKSVYFRLFFVLPDYIKYKSPYIIEI